MERQIYDGQLDLDVHQKERDKAREDWLKQRRLHEQGEPSEVDRYDAIATVASHTPVAGCSCYKLNEVFLDLRTPFDEMRGGITFAAACFLAPVLTAAVSFPGMIMEMMSGLDSSGEPLPLEGYFAYVFVITLFSIAVGGAFYFGWRHLRLDAFVQRRLVVRFNRVTRKVYLHRPPYAGGILELPWDGCLASATPPSHQAKNEAFGVGVPLTLYWPHDRTPHGREEIVFVGRLSRSTSELVNLWEFIRRYMEEGPQAVPAPQLIGRFPWPWRGLQSAWSFIWPAWQVKSLEWARWLIVLGSPAILLFAVGQWLALLTCWEPVFPKAIRQVCNEGWGSVLKARLIDAGAWGMLAALVAGIYWAIQAQ